MTAHPDLPSLARSLRLNASLYSREALLAAAYWYLNRSRYRVRVEADGNEYVVTFTPVAGYEPPAGSRYLDDQEFLDRVLDEQLRLALAERTSRYHELIVKHAFTPVDLATELKT